MLKENGGFGFLCLLVLEKGLKKKLLPKIKGQFSKKKNIFD